VWSDEHWHIISRHAKRLVDLEVCAHRQAYRSVLWCFPSRTCQKFSDVTYGMVAGAVRTLVAKTFAVLLYKYEKSTACLLTTNNCSVHMVNLTKRISSRICWWLREIKMKSYNIVRRKGVTRPVNAKQRYAICCRSNRHYQISLLNSPPH
jgi:hypothetical protein